MESQIEDYPNRKELQEPEFTEEDESVDEYCIARNRPRRVTRLLARFRLNDMVSFTLTIAEDIVDYKPRNYKGVMRSKDSAEWSKGVLTGSHQTCIGILYFGQILPFYVTLEVNEN